MKLVSKNPINNTSKVVRNSLTGELVYQTPWVSDFLTDDCQIAGDLKEYFKCIPRIRFMTSREERENENTLGWVLDGSIVLKQHDNVLSTVVHEIQHCLQEEDGRSRGGNSRHYRAFIGFMEKNPRHLMRGVNEVFWNQHLINLCKEWEECKKWMKKRAKWNFLLDSFDSTLYRHLVGEIEAREAEGAVGEIHEDMVHTREEGMTGLLKRKGWRTLAYYINKEVFEEHKQEAKRKAEQYWMEENKRRREKQMELQKQKEESYDPMEVIEDYYWSVLGDEYRASMHKSRTNYKKKNSL